MLTAQQAAAKEAAHQRFDAPPPSPAHWIQKNIELASRYDDDDASGNRDVALLEHPPRFTPGIAGIGIADDMLRIYVFHHQAPDIDIPPDIEGLRTVRVPTPGFHTLTPPRRQALSPVSCGVSIGISNVTATLGCLVDTPSRRCILSNNHVLANTNAASPGEDVFQPGPDDETPSNPARRIARLTDYEHIGFGSAINHIDAAVAALDRRSSTTPHIMTIGLPANPPVTAFLNQSVAKHGRTTGLTFGSVVDISFDGTVDLNGPSAYFENQIVIAGSYGPFSDSGDSGSLVVDSPGSHPVGLLFAGDHTHTLANPIGAVLNRFGATIVTA